MPTPLSSLLTTCVSAAVSISWMVLITRSTGFHQKLGIMFRFDLGLYYMEVGPSWGTRVLNAVGPTKWIVSKFMKRDDDGKLINHQLSIFTMKQNICGLPHTIMHALGLESAEACTLWLYVEWSSLFLIFLVVTGVVLLIIGACFSHWYWSGEPRKKTRQCANGWLVGALTMFIFGILQYTLCTMGFSAWLELWGDSQAPTFSHNYMFAVSLTGVSAVPLIIQVVFAGKHDLEAVSDEVREVKKIAREDNLNKALVAEFQGHGQGHGQQRPQQPQQQPVYTSASAMGGGASGGYGQQQSMGQPQPSMGQQQPMGGQQVHFYQGGGQPIYEGDGGGYGGGYGGGCAGDGGYGGQPIYEGGGYAGDGGPPIGGPAMGGPSMGGPPMDSGGDLTGGGKTDAPLPIRKTQRVAWNQPVAWKF